MTRSRSPLLAASLLVLSAASLRAQALNPSGHWEGAIQAPGHVVSIEVDLTRSASGELLGAFSNPSQGVKGFPLANVAADGPTVRFELKANSGGGTFVGTLSADGRTLSGTFTTAQVEHPIPFSLTRTGDARVETAAKSAPIGKDLEGTWNGTLDVNGKEVRLILTMSNQPDASAVGTIVNANDGLNIPITAITQKASSLTLDVRTVGGAYSGTLNAQGTELSGTWTQGSMALPLIFRRAAR